MFVSRRQVLDEIPIFARFTALDYGRFCDSCRVVWLATSSRADFATRGLSISFLTRASVAWLDSCIGLFFFMFERCHESNGITGHS
jgi:hypothetical protein